VVVATGPDVRLFRNGDEVWYAGSIVRQGADAELHLVDERIVGSKPRSLTFAQAAAMPLTTITAWELLFDRFQIQRGIDKKANRDAALLIIGAAGGVGSILTQLASALTRMTVIGTASRAESQEWVRSLGAHYVIDHQKPLPAQLRRLPIPDITHVASLTHTDEHFKEIVECIAPQGAIGLIDDPRAVDVQLMKQKALSLRWEAMFARSMFGTADMIRQHELLNEVSNLVDDGAIRTTATEHFGRIDAQSLKKAHAFVENGRTIGKIVLEGF
jgi:zinc-binding alcohol dehydrogenase family protein